jgi:hypothetical protein
MQAQASSRPQQMALQGSTNAPLAYLSGSSMPLPDDEGHDYDYEIDDVPAKRPMQAKQDLLHMLSSESKLLQD